jgi:hypothetical protein
MVMSYVHHYSHLFDIPLARVVRGKRGASDIVRDREQADLIDTGFSDYGIDPRFPSGWYIVPAFVVAVLVIVALLTF